MILALLLSCATDVEELPCREDFTRAADGHCYPDGELQSPPSLDDLFALMEPCVGLRPSTQVDLEAGCAGDLCAGDLYTVALLVMGEPAECFSGSGDVYCSWTTGLGGRWDDDDADGIPDPTARNIRVQVEEPFVPGTASGLGIWMPPSCYVDALGTPDDLTLIDTDEGLFLERINYDAYGLLAYDLIDLEGRAGPDGLIDALYLYGAP